MATPLPSGAGRPAPAHNRRDHPSPAANGFPAPDGHADAAGTGGCGEAVPFRLPAEVVPQLVWRSLDDGRGGLEAEHRLRRADGAFRWFQTRAAPLRDARARTVPPAPAPRRAPVALGVA